MHQKNFLIILIFSSFVDSKHKKKFTNLSATQAIRDVIEEFLVNQEIGDFEIVSCCE
jgi:hypothetical protein